jgi:hypothetical protein
MAKIFAQRRLVVLLLALVVISAVAAVCGNPWLGMWEGPL